MKMIIVYYAPHIGSTYRIYNVYTHNIKQTNTADKTLGTGPLFQSWSAIRVRVRVRVRIAYVWNSGPKSNTENNI